jgi:hypothetical protein
MYGMSVKIDPGVLHGQGGNFTALFLAALRRRPHCREGRFAATAFTIYQAGPVPAYLPAR